MIKAAFFDMNETLLNLSVLKQTFDKYFSDDYVVKYWFAKLLHTSTVIGITEDYKNFGELSSAVLENIFYEQQKEFTSVIKEDILGAFKKLPAYDDVAESLQKLQEHDVKVIAVSNSSLAMMQEQLTNAQILDLFDNYYSVDAVQRYKPFQGIYQYVAKEEGLAVQDVVMVATHDWDLTGAKQAGLKTGYVTRKKEIYNPYYKQADYRAESLLDLVDKILAS